MQGLAACLTDRRIGAVVDAKLDAARDLGVRVVVIERPSSPTGVPGVTTVADALTWLDGSRLGWRR